jgi:hypothetical protein
VPANARHRQKPHRVADGQTPIEAGGETAFLPVFTGSTPVPRVFKFSRANLAASNACALVIEHFV